MSKKNYIRPLSFLIIVATIFFSFYGQKPQYQDDLNAPKEAFSTDRALSHLAIIANKPHYVGTSEHSTVRNYIVDELKKLGLNVSIQEQEAVNSKYNAGAKIFNILTRIKGTNSGKALMLLTHYDSSPHSSFGASDAGSGVVTILESIRAYLATGEKPKNDIIIMISDAEELGLLGAKAFVKHHPWAKDIGLVINLEARGSGGPSYMLLETNGGNHQFIKAFNKAKTSHPVGNSLMYSIYKMLPNNTDLTVFREDGNIDGFNFAFIDDHYDYHTAQDTYERLNKSTLAHQGSYVLPLLKHFSNADLTELKGQTDDVFFNFPGFGVVYYSFELVFIMIVLFSVLFIYLFTYGIRKKKLTFKGSLTSFIPYTLSILIAGLLGFYGWKFIEVLFPQHQDILHGFTYNGHLYIIAFSCLIIGVLFWIYHKYLKRRAVPDLLVAPIVFWVILNLLLALKLKGGGFFIIPLIAMMVSWATLLFTNDRPNKRIWLFTLLAIPILLIFPPLVKMLPVGLGLGSIWISLVLIVLIFGSILSIFGYYANSRRLSKLFFGIALLAFITAFFKSDFNENRKQPNNIVFIQDDNSKEAHWVSYNRENDTFTQQFLGTKPQKGNFSTFFSNKYNSKINFYTKTNTREITPPLVQKSVNDTLYENRDVYEYLLKAQRASNQFYITTKDSISFYNISFNGEAYDKKEDSEFVFTATTENPKIISYYLADGTDGLHIKMEVPKHQIPNLELFEISYDLLDNPLFEIRPRSINMMPTPFVMNDAIILKKDL